jgi:predicted FMN-binding regulatory protein PaiB
VKDACYGDSALAWLYWRVVPSTNHLGILDNHSFYKPSNLAVLVAKFALKMQACALPRAVQAGKLHWQVNWTKSVLADANCGTRLHKRIQEALKIFETGFVSILTAFWGALASH